MGELVSDISAFHPVKLSAWDGSITAVFVPFGATLTELWVKNKHDEPIDVVLGYDDPSELATDPGRPVFNCVVGRYANRIRDGRFSIPISKSPVAGGKNVYNLETNDAGGKATLHCGSRGWDQQVWSIISQTRTSVTFRFVDEGGTDGTYFPGDVVALVTHSVSNDGLLTTNMRATAKELTPIMLTQHIYWNLDGFRGPEPNVLAHRLRISGSSTIAVDEDSMPSGPFVDVENSPRDFRKERGIGERWEASRLVNANGLPGYNDCWILDKDAAGSPDGSDIMLYSLASGIKLEINTDQPAVQVYTGYWLDTPRKSVHGGPSTRYSKFSAVAIEQQGLTGAINMPEWNVDHIYGPSREYTWKSSYRFSIQ